MSGITLSSSVRQNLLSLQSTAELLSTTQNRLSTGNKVNSALDNPTNFFTAASLNSRSSDINNLLDGIGNGVQILQAANTGITSLTKLVDSAKSIANQALQTTVGYAKSSLTSTALSGATAANLLGDAGGTDATFTGAAATGTATAAFTNTARAAGTQLFAGTATNAATTTLISALTTTGNVAAAPAVGDSFLVNGKTVTFSTSGAAATDSTTGNVTIGLDQNLGALATAIDGITGNTTSASTATAGIFQINTGLAANVTLADGTGGVLAKLGLTAGTTTRGGGAVTAPALAGATKLSGVVAGATGAISTAFAANDTLTVNGQTLTFKASGASGANEINITDDVTALLGKIDGLTGTATASSITSGVISLHTGTAKDLTITSSNNAALTALGLGTSVSKARVPAPSPIAGLTLTIGATGGGTATSITFGTGANQISTLDDLNTSLAANNLQATLDTTGKLTITTTNDAASANIGAIGGTAITGATGQFNGKSVVNAVKDVASQATRASLIAQYNQVVDQITTTAQDSSFNGVNLLNGDTLKLTFNETGSSKLGISGVSFGPGGLGLSKLAAGTDFTDNASTNKVLASLTTASTSLRSQASAFGSNLSVVQIRQDFSKSLINVLQTGASNLTLADTNEEAANSQALSTRQSIGVSALSLANTAQQGVLQLLR
jgi:flagellin